MNQSISAMARSLLLPLALFLAAYLSVAPLQDIPRQRLFLVEWMPYGAIALAGVIAFLFSQSRLFFIALLLALAYWSTGRLRGDASGAEYQGLILACTLLWPLNLTVLSGVREKGLFNGNGVLMGVVVLVQFGLMLWLVRQQPGLLEYLWQPFLPLSLSQEIPHLALLVLLLSVLWLAVRHWRQPSVLNASLLLMPAALLAALHWRGVPVVSEVIFSATAVMLSLGIILEIHRIAYRDDLTGLPARRALNLRLAAPGRRYMIAMLDVDHFKQFNDTFGHDVGDEVLRMVATRIQAVGGGGTAYRYGGEEFAIVFPGGNRDRALKHLERVRESVAGYRLALRSRDRPKQSREGRQKRGRSPARKTVSVTISIGLAARDRDNRQPDTVLKAADKALYRAKGAGRNRVMLHGG
ncbi:MAG: GGDEF domain-containing protein [Oleiphilaceae bacterium]|nr:GGDEF domain-containing protein [Oleiphilaceae bacterium]